jgi:hypothetical protein
MALELILNNLNLCSSIFYTKMILNSLKIDFERFLGF